MRAESGGREIVGGRPTISRAGAMGLMQLMPATWREMRSLIGIGADPYDPRDNILAGAAYLRLMYDRFGYPGLFAAYNAGPARYAAALSGARQLPVETRFYVTQVGGGARPTRVFARFAAAGAPATPAAGLFVIAPATGLVGAAPRLSPQRSRGLFIELAGGTGR
jgi:SLT domain-containing protein